MCVQRYLSSPLLLSSRLKVFPNTRNAVYAALKQFDIRVYALVTSWDPVRFYLYRDGLVRFCTEEYTASPAEVGRRAAHITNPEVGRAGGRYRDNTHPDTTTGHKVRLQSI